MNNNKYTLNAVVFSEEDFIPKTCDIHKLNLTNEQKLKQFKKHLSRRYDYLKPERIESSWEYTNADFYLIKCKDSFLKDLESGKIKFFLYDDGCSVCCIDEIKNLLDWSSCVGTCLNDFDFITKSEDQRNQVWFIDNDSDIFEEEEEEK